jgi:hypothetical protein
MSTTKVWRVFFAVLFLWFWISAVLSPVRDEDHFWQIKAIQALSIEPHFFHLDDAETVGYVAGRGILMLIIWGFVDRAIRRSAQRAESKGGADVGPQH